VTHPRSGPALFLIGAFVILISSLPGCAARYRLSPADPEETRSEAALQGVWDGFSVNACTPFEVDLSRCRAMERITFTMLRQSEKISGFYRCSPGTALCYDSVQSGVVRHMQLDGRMLSFRVTRNDGTSCVYNTIPSASTMKGSFFCFDDDSTERGFWQVHREY
jgi:hypothetical protein